MPASAPAPSNQERLENLLGLIQGQATPEARQTIARELLLQDWPETPPRLAALLAGSNSAAKIATASALADLPQRVNPLYIDPLIAMLSDSDQGARQAAAAALAAYANDGVAARLRELALDSGRPRATRLAAINALGLMIERQAIETLATALADPDRTIAQAALAALGQATAQDFNEDLAAARSWWSDNKDLPAETWQRQHVQRLARRERELRRRLETVEARLGKLLEGGFLRSADGERTALLSSYLSDTLLTIRLLGLRLAQLHLTEGKSLPPELQVRIRERLRSPDPREQAAAVQTVASFREGSDAATFLEMLATARTSELRLALVNALGYVGGENAIAPLLSTLESNDELFIAEAAAALGRLAERGVLPDGARDTVAQALLASFERTQLTQTAARERIIWAMGNIADPRFAPAFVAALDRREAVIVRQAAARGIAALKSQQLADSLTAAADDPDIGVRKIAIETLAAVGSANNELHLRALWERSANPPETDEAIRQAAWRGLLELLARGSLDDVDRWLVQATGNGPESLPRATEMLSRLVETAAAGESVDRSRLGLLRVRLAAVQTQLRQPTAAVAAYTAALADLASTRPEEARRVASDLLRYALSSGCYDSTAAAALSTASELLDSDLLWQVAKAEIEPRLTPAAVSQALDMLAALERHPPGSWSAKAQEEMAWLRRQAERIASAAPASAPTSQLPTPVGG